MNIDWKKIVIVAGLALGVLDNGDGRHLFCENAL